MDNAQNWHRVLNIIRQYKQPFIVVSATARTTRQLLNAAQTALSDPEQAQKEVLNIQQRHLELVANFLHECSSHAPAVGDRCKQWIYTQGKRLMRRLDNIHHARHLSERDKDAVLATGELLSSYLLAQCAEACGLSTHWIDAGRVIRTDSNFGDAQPDIDCIRSYISQEMQSIASRQIPIMGGYYGKNAGGDFTTLGFEGSDFSASIVGAALSARSIEIWTDVSGIYTCDPRIVANARPVPNLSFEEAGQLAHFGAKVLHPSTTWPAARKNIPILVKNIFSPCQPGTTISTEGGTNGLAKAMALKNNMVTLTVTAERPMPAENLLGAMFDLPEAKRLSMQILTLTGTSFTAAVEQADAGRKLIPVLENLGYVEIIEHQSIIGLVGCTPRLSSILMGHMLDSFDAEMLSLLSFNPTKRILNAVVDERNVIPAVQALHRRLFLESQ